MKTLEELKRTPHLCICGRFNVLGTEGVEIYNGWIEWPDFKGSVIFGFNESGCMEHVSISSYKRRQIPSWDVMCRLKDMFFYPEEMVVQIHPAKSRYLHGVKNIRGETLENVLHLWRPMNGDFSLLNTPEKWD